MKLKHFLLIITLLISFLFINIFSYATTVSNNLQNNIFRLHILANSNSQIDQNLKLSVRDDIINYMESINLNSKSKEDTIKLVNDNLENIQKIAENTIKANGFNYPVNIEIGNFYFPTKHYGNISLPQGNYDALRICIGEAQGQNWWCSLFPPLCFIDISSGIVENDDKEILKENLNDEEFAIISSSSPDVKLKFKLLEILNSK